MRLFVNSNLWEENLLSLSGRDGVESFDLRLCLRLSVCVSVCLCVTHTHMRAHLRTHAHTRTHTHTESVAESSYFFSVSNVNGLLMH